MINARGVLAVRQHCDNPFAVTAGHQAAVTQTSSSFGVFFGQDMAAVGLSSLDLTRAGIGKSLGGSSMSF